MSNNNNNANEVDLTQDIFAALIDNHEIQRALCDKLESTKDEAQRKAIYEELKLELHSHAAAEERHLYVPVMQHDDGLDLSRHAITEHHEMDELVEKLEETDMSNPSWLATAKQLSEKVHHHLKEEEHKFFQQAGKILEDDEKEKLGKKYLTEYQKYKNADRSFSL